MLAVKAILGAWQDGTRLDFPARFTPAHADADVGARPNRTAAPQSLLGTLGRLMTRTAAEVADGLRDAVPRATGIPERTFPA